MRFLLFLLLGILIFGWAFPAMILLVGVFAIFLVGVMLWRMLRGGSSFKVYTSGDFRGCGRNDEEDEDDGTYEGESVRRRVYIDDGPSASRRPADGDEEVINVATVEEDMEEESGEIVELPATALRPDDEENKGNIDRSK